MTFSILARDPKTNTIGGAAATGSLCVGGWVLRGDARVGMSASQGASPSTLWGEAVLEAMKSGESASQAVNAVTAPDSGRSYRQLSALGRSGPGAAFTGADNTPAMGSQIFEGGVVAGNMLASQPVLQAMIEGFTAATGPFAERLLAALNAANAAGSDARGLLSAALLVLSPDRPPLTLRIDYSQSPLDDLAALYRHATTGEYAKWCDQVPTLDAPERSLD